MRPEDLKAVLEELDGKIRRLEEELKALRALGAWSSQANRGLRPSIRGRTPIQGYEYSLKVLSGGKEIVSRRRVEGGA